MRPTLSPLLPFLSLAGILAVGCQSDGGRASVFQRQRPALRPSADYGGAYDTGAYDDPDVSPWEARRNPNSGSSYGSRRAPAADPRSASAREATRIAELEATVARLQSQLDSMSAAQADVVAQAGATVSRSGAVVDTVRGDIAALRADVEALKAENRSVREEQARQKAQMDGLPDKIVAKVNAIMPKAPPPAPRTQSSQQRRATEGWEHTVASGDTLSAIASAYGVRQSDIIRENGLKDANSLRVGQTLFIPKP